jgi:signal transduction histidine kinase
MDPLYFFYKEYLYMLSPTASSWAQLFDGFSNPVILSDSNQCIQYFNVPAQQLFSAFDQPLTLKQELPSALTTIFSVESEERFSAVLSLNETLYEVTTHTLDGSVLFFLQRKTEQSIPPQLLLSLVNKIQDITAPLMYVSQLLVPIVESINNPKSERYLSILNQNCYRLVRIMHMLSMFEKSLDSSSLPDSSDQCNITDVCHKVAAQVGPLAKQLQLDFSLEGAEGSHTVHGKSIHLERMLYQLISNAMKFTPAGGEIKLQMKVVSQRVYLTVSDTGIGVPDHMLNTIFHRFEEEGAFTDISSGVGLGLSFVRHVARLSDGTVALTSKEGKGTRVTITLPLEKPSYTLHTPTVALESDLSLALVELSDALPSSCFLPSDLE